ncbi:phosphatidate cytidylyltransferase [Spiribacter vilamensis]|uniref:Phosphatidate cytidylyltransferase n=1 Tax=Spiribacter vilamensis TaxID=531306 RepID=A0A4Q8CZI9_9GAMM|nr:phosphatidate cytidylyltransferase [Spiribacter vilamensis]RZU98451.1 phosphatidate cytidylyltransferase [Spiribacter vilamensis]TVO60675.1 phosphatidate cytidylyltransferase [Spiribacter vilamensis]
MLRQRILTAVPLALGVLALIWQAPAAWVQIVMAAAMLVGAGEWADLSGYRRPSLKLAYAGVVAALLGLAALVDLPAQAGWRVPGVLWWLAIGVWLIYQARRSAPAPLPGWLRGGAGLITLTLAWVSVAAIHGQPEVGPLWLTVLVVLVWGADIGGYFAGRRYGRHKLAPSISPGKTWEGVVGGLALAMALVISLRAITGGVYAGLPGYGWLIAVAVMVVLFSVVGDLSESVLKRQAGRKDSGRLLPGHGGLLDRIDALLAAAPVLAAALVSVP